jgi:hypothetical protein
MSGLAILLHILWFLTAPPPGASLLASPQRAWPAALVLEELADHFTNAELTALLADLQVQDPQDALAAARLRATLLVRQGRPDDAEALLLAQGLPPRWTLLLPQHLAGLPVLRPRGAPQASLSDFPTRNLDSAPVLETRLDLPPLPMLYLEAQGEGLAELELAAPALRQRLQPQGPGTLLRHCGPNPGKDLRLRLTLDPYRAALPFSVRATALRKCPPPGPEAQGPFALWWRHRDQQPAPVPDHQALLAFRPGPLELWLLGAALPEHPELLASLCHRLPWCAGTPLASLFAAQAHWERGQTLRASLALGFPPLAPPDPSAPPASPFFQRLRHRLAAQLQLSLDLPRSALAALRGTPAPLAPEDLDLWLAAAMALSDRDALRQAITQLSTLYPGHSGLRSAAATGLAELGLRQEALTLLGPDLDPFSPLRFQRVRLLRELDRPADYRRALEDLLAANPADDQALRLLFDLCGSTGDDPCLAQTSARLETLLAPEPECRSCAFLPSARLWRSLALTLPQIQALPAAAASSFLADTWWISVGAGGLRSLHRQQVVEVQGRPDQQLRLGAWYDSHTEDLVTLEALVLSPDGQVRPAGEGDDRGLGDDEYNSYYDLRHRTMVFTGLQPGDRVLWTWRLVQHRNAGAGFSLLRFLQDELPKVRLRLTVSAPAGTGLRHALLWPLPGEAPVLEVSSSPTQEFLNLEFSGLPALRDLPFPAPDTRRAAILILGTSDSWDSLLRWYDGLLRPLAVPGPQVLALVEQHQLEGLEGRALLAELTRHISDEVRYVAMEIGVNSFVPYDINLTLERRFGDCKDQSLLLAAALTTAGIEAVPAVIRTAPRGPLEEVPVSIALFDHALVYVPSEQLFLDPTVPFLGLNSLPWQDQGALALPILPGLDQPLTIPVDGADVNTEALTLRFTRAPGQGLAIQGQLAAAGTRVRARLVALNDPEGTRDLARELLGRFFTVKDLTQATATLRRQDSGAATLELAALGTLGTGGIAPGLRYQHSLAGAATREEALLLPFPFVDRVHLTADFDAFLPTPRTTHDSPHCAWTLEISARSLDLELRLPERQVNAPAYAPFRDCLGALDRALAATRIRDGGQP